VENSLENLAASTPMNLLESNLLFKLKESADCQISLRLSSISITPELFLTLANQNSFPSVFEGAVFETDSAINSKRQSSFWKGYLKSSLTGTPGVKVPTAAYFKSVSEVKEPEIIAF